MESYIVRAEKKRNFSGRKGGNMILVNSVTRVFGSCHVGLLFKFTIYYVLHGLAVGGLFALEVFYTGSTYRTWR